MNPVEIGTGKSFKGLAAYLLHDPDRAATAERVGWVQSYNLDDAPPDRAWRLMASTAMSADQIKAAAGVKKGKAAKNTAYHFSLSFDPKDQPSEAVQRAAVEGALKAIGLEQYQALAVAHTDTPHAHVHVMVNLISPEHGVSAASPKQPDGRGSPLSYAQKKLSQWAAAFEREHGLAITQGRLENANRRAEGERVDARRKPRNVYERGKNETVDLRRDFVKRAIDDKARDLSAESRAMHEQHRTAWDALKASYGAEKTARDTSQRRAMPALIERIKESHKPRWGKMFARQRDETRDFERGEKTAIGRVWHAAAVFKDRALAGDALGGFVAAFSPEARRTIVMRKHDRERAKLGAEIREQISREIDALKRSQAQARDQARRRYLEACEQLKRDQAAERDAMRERWQSHNESRKAALANGRSRDVGRGVDIGRDFGLGRGRGFEPQ